MAKVSKRDRTISHCVWTVARKVHNYRCTIDNSKPSYETDDDIIDLRDEIREIVARVYDSGVRPLNIPAKAFALWREAWEKDARARVDFANKH